MPQSTQLEKTLWLACALESTARKPGNVHPEASFGDLTHADMLRAAEVTAPILAQTTELGVGETILQAVQATHVQQLGNANLGIILLLAPLAAVPYEVSLRTGLSDVLRSLTIDDAAKTYQAIRLANPGGMGATNEQDVAQEPTVTLLQAMKLAADHDLVAAQYANSFADVLRFGQPELTEGLDFVDNWEREVIELQLRLMAEFPDSLIARKCGQEVAVQSAELAKTVLDSGWPVGEESQRRLSEFDEWLRSDGNRRNPGTTADMVAACLFAALRESDKTDDIIVQLKHESFTIGNIEKSI